jgi:hypothetical protein
MGREDQIEEREVLDSIFPDEITGKQYSSLQILWGTPRGNTRAVLAG